METTQLFAITFLAALLGVIPPGMVNMSVAKTCLQTGKKNGILVAIGASVIVFFQALIAILLAKYIFNNPYVYSILMRTGLVIFFLMAVYFFIIAKRKTQINIDDKNNHKKSFLKGIMISALNVLPIPYFCAISTAFNAKGDIHYDGFSLLFFSLAAASGTMLTLYLYVISFMKIENKKENFAKKSNYFMAGLMLVLVLITLIRIYYPWA